MRELINVRASVDLFQQELAQLLGTTSITVNRWENGRSVPNIMAQRTLYRFCEEKGINIVSYLVERIGRAAEWATILYHALQNGIVSVTALISRNKCDFGTGFYTGTNPLQPLMLVCDEEKPVFLRCDCIKTGSGCYT
ncbi:MAG: hypothetical protein Q4B57_07300 [Eubacteriales bacterium]|nr:hypothetical protein [Eubacteriales bacterium]